MIAYRDRQHAARRTALDELAAAIEAGADVLLTWNLRDFPQAAMAAHDMTAETPDALLARLCETRRDELLAVLREARSSLKNPPLTGASDLDTLSNQGLKHTCSVLEAFQGFLESAASDILIRPEKGLAHISNNHPQFLSWPGQELWVIWPNNCHSECHSIFRVILKNPRFHVAGSGSLRVVLRMPGAPSIRT